MSRKVFFCHLLLFYPGLSTWPDWHPLIILLAGLRPAWGGESKRGHLALRQGTKSHRRELKRVLSPKWLLIMAALPASPSPRLSSQARGTRGCRDGVACDGRCTETVASGANRRDSALRYSCREAAGRRDPHSLLP